VNLVLTTLGWVALVLAFFSRKGTAAGTGNATSVSILKPVHGSEPGLQDNLSSHFRQVTQAKVEVIIGAVDPGDAAVAVAEAVIAENPNVACRFRHGAADHGHNRKISNVMNMLELAGGDVLVLSDSDIGVPADHLDRVLEALDAPGVGVVTCPYYGTGEAGFWSRFAAMNITYGFLPNVITGVGLGLAKPCMGSTLAFRRETLEQIGGAHIFKDALADDYAIGSAIRGAGLESVVAPVLVSHSCADRRLRSLLLHELRWSQTIRGIDFYGHLGSVITHPLALAVLAAVALGFSPVALGVLGLAAAARLWVVATVDRVVGRGPGDWWLIPARDVASFCVFVGSFFVQTIEWRGTRFRVTADGDLSPI
jgi:ceramide glucosyltransferase